MIASGWVDLLSLEVVQRSLAALVVASLAFPIVGVFIVGLDIVAVRFAVMHIALLGGAVALALGFDPMLLAVALCSLAPALLAPLARSPSGLGGGVGLVMPTSIALALIVVSLVGVNSRAVFGLLWGSVLTVSSLDLVLMACLAATVVGLFAWRRRDLALLLFDQELATCSGVAVERLLVAVLVVIGMAIAAAIPLTGALLVDALTVLPAVAARNVAHSLGSMAGWAVAFGVAGSVLGFSAALVLDQPPGPVLVLAGALIVVATFVWSGRS